MTIERLLRGIAGFFILLSLALAYFHHWYWLFFTGFVGLNLLQSSFTNWCPMMDILRRLGLESGNAGCHRTTPTNPSSEPGR